MTNAKKFNVEVFLTKCLTEGKFIVKNILIHEAKSLPYYSCL